MDRGYGSGYSGWGGGGPGGRGTHADSIIAKINERLDMLSQLEGGVKTERRYDHFESMDSRSSMASSRDLYRSGGYGFGADRGDNMLLAHRGGSGFGGGMGVGSGAGYDDFSSYGVAKMRPNMREPFGGGQGASSGGWASSNRHSPRRGGNTGGFGGHRGHSPGGGRGKLPSLLSNRMYPESGGFHQGPHDFSGRNFGGGPRAGRQRKRPLNKVKQQPQKKKKKGPPEGDEPESKINKTESTGADSAAGGGSEPQDKNGHGDESKPAQSTAAADTAEKAEAKTEGGTPQNKGPSHHKQMKNRRGFIDRLMYTCSVCKLRCFYKEDLEAHLESRFHKDHFKYLQSQLTKPTVDFLQGWPGGRDRAPSWALAAGWATPDPTQRSTTSATWRESTTTHDASRGRHEVCLACGPGSSGRRGSRRPIRDWSTAEKRGSGSGETRDATVALERRGTRRWRAGGPGETQDLAEAPREANPLPSDGKAQVFRTSRDCYC
uniref:C2H2 AKAP95-type domain-containing protein n=1 Tax=Knipowitschia caucasica TaxID=637954 RepID=A0AAV2LKH5_KNICA